MRAMRTSRIAALGVLAGLVTFVPGSAVADCGSCLEGVRECAGASMKEFAKCRMECRVKSDILTEKLECFTACVDVRDGELEMCGLDGSACVEECEGIVDVGCLGACASAFRVCVGGAKGEFGECLKGNPSCLQGYRHDRGICSSLGDYRARKTCKQFMRGTYGECLHGCGEEISGEVHACFAELRECVAACAPLCAGTAPECGGLCPWQSECVPSESGCECVPTGITKCGESHPECDGACPPGSECGSVDEGLACGCVPAGNIPCGKGSTPECDGACPGGLSCREAFGRCVCAPGGGIGCGEIIGPPECRGLCPLETPICVDRNGLCECVGISEPPACGEVFGPPMCIGLCPPETPICKEVEGACTCTPLPEPPPCAEARFPFCGGLCPEGEICLLDFGLETCSCKPEQVLQCGELLGPPLCAGLCPPDKPICRELEDTCQCTGIPEPPACGELFGPPACGGFCPPEAPICREVEGVCACTPLPEPPPCGEAHFPFCGGVCPGGELCLPDLDSKQCQCKTEQALECGGLVGPPMCLGLCPSEAPVCKEMEGTCTCTSTPGAPACAETDFPFCGGVCPGGELCLPDLDSRQCQCKTKEGLACGELVGPPLCLGLCPPEAPLCHNVGGQCLCG